MTSDPTPTPTAPPSPELPRSRRWPLLASIVPVAVLGGGSWYLFIRNPELPTAERVERVAPSVTPAPVEAEPEVQIAGTDPRVRELLRGLSNDTEFLRWLSVDDLARRFVSATNAVAEGQSPRVQLSFLAPTAGFRVARRAGRTVIAPESYARFDGIARAIASVNTQGVQRVYQELKPLLDAAYAELAPPGRTFDQALAQAIGRLTAVAVPTGLVEVTPKGALYAYEDPHLEALSGAEKHLLRMGPENMRKVQTKLSEIALTLDLPAPPEARQP